MLLDFDRVRVVDNDLTETSGYFPDPALHF